MTTPKNEEEKTESHRHSFPAPFSLNALQQSELRYRRLFESARDGILILNENGVITDANPYMAEFLGCTPDELLHKQLWEIGFSDKQASQNAVEQLKNTGYLRHDDLPIQTRSGEKRAVEIVSNVYDEGDRIVIQCNIRDITQRKRAEEALRLSEAAVRASESRFRALTERSSDMVTVVAPNGTVLYESPSVAAVLGHLPGELMGTDGLARVHPDNREPVVGAMRLLAAGERIPDCLVYRCRRKNGDWCWLESIISNQVDNPPVGGFVFNSRDVTERMRFQQQIIQTEKLAALGELVSGVAHEINNPLSAISGHAQLLKKHTDPQVKEDAHAIEAMVLRATRIVRSLRSYARTSPDALPQVADPNEAITMALDVVSPLLRRMDVTVQLRLNPGLPPVLLNPGEMEQVMVNLITNAQYAMQAKNEDERVVHISTHLQSGRGSGGGDVDAEQPQKWCVIKVQDSGTGMSEAARVRVFDPFFTTKEVGEGTGLGLYISHGIITAHRGTIEVESREGEGTIFTIFLPVAVQEPAAEKGV